MLSKELLARLPLSFEDKCILVEAYHQNLWSPDLAKVVQPSYRIPAETQAQLNYITGVPFEEALAHGILYGNTDYVCNFYHASDWDSFGEKIKHELTRLPRTSLFDPKDVKHILQAHLEELSINKYAIPKSLVMRFVRAKGDISPSRLKKRYPTLPSFEYGRTILNEVEAVLVHKNLLRITLELSSEQYAQFDVALNDIELDKRVAEIYKRAGVSNKFFSEQRPSGTPPVTNSKIGLLRYLIQHRWDVNRIPSPLDYGVISVTNSGDSLSFLVREILYTIPENDPFGLQKAVLLKLVDPITWWDKQLFKEEATNEELVLLKAAFLKFLHEKEKTRTRIVSALWVVRIDTKLDRVYKSGRVLCKNFSRHPVFRSEMYKRLVEGYYKFKDEPIIRAIFEAIKE